MGRKLKELTSEQKIQVEALAAYLTQEQIADYFSLSRTTFYEMMKRDEEISERYKRGKALAIAKVGQGVLQKAIAGDAASSFFYLKTQAGWRETNNLNHVSEDGTMAPKPTVIELVAKHDEGSG